MAKLESEHRVQVVWRGGEDGDSRAHEIRLSEQTLACSSASEYRGDPDKADPEQLLVAAASSCHMLWFLALARKRKLQVASYGDEPVGTMDGERFTRVTLRPRVAFEGDPPTAEVFDELHHEAHERCFIANSISCPVEIEPAIG